MPLGIGECDWAIALMEALRQALEPRGAWDPPFCGALANAYVRRGAAKQATTGYNSAAAIVDYDQAIAQMEALREMLEPRGASDIPVP